MVAVEIRNSAKNVIASMTTYDTAMRMLNIYLIEQSRRKPRCEDLLGIQELPLQVSRTT